MMENNPVVKLTWWDKILGMFGTKTTWKWCVVGCTIGRHSWRVSYEKCHNDIPIISGGLLMVYGCDSKQDADAVYEDFKTIAKEHNEKNGYWI